MKVGPEKVLIIDPLGTTREQVIFYLISYFKTGIVSSKGVFLCPLLSEESQLIHDELASNFFFFFWISNFANLAIKKQYNAYDCGCWVIFDCAMIIMTGSLEYMTGFQENKVPENGPEESGQYIRRFIKYAKSQIPKNLKLLKLSSLKSIIKPTKKRKIEENMVMDSKILLLFLFVYLIL